MRCEEVADLLPQIMDGPETAERRVVRHVEGCLRCQAEMVQYRRLLRVLHQLRAQEPEPPPGLVGAILAGLEEVGQRGAIRSVLTGRRVGYVGGLALAVGAAGVAGAVLVNRGRGSRIGLAG